MGTIENIGPIKEESDEPIDPSVEAVSRFEAVDAVLEQLDNPELVSSIVDSLGGQPPEDSSPVEALEEEFEASEEEIVEISLVSVMTEFAQQYNGEGQESQEQSEQNGTLLQGESLGEMQHIALSVAEELSVEPALVYEVISMETGHSIVNTEGGSAEQAADPMGEGGDGLSSETQIASPVVTPELHQQIVDALITEVQSASENKEKLAYAIEIAGEIQNYVQGEMYGDKDSIISAALTQTSEQTGVSVEELQSFMENPDILNMEMFESHGDMQVILNQLLASLSNEIDLARLSDIDIDGLNINELISSFEVSEEQKEQWLALLNLDIPQNARVKVIYVFGGKNLDMSGEIDAMRAGFNGMDLDQAPSIVEIDNLTLSKDEILQRVEEEMRDESYDVVIPFFSSHGFTMSTEENGGLAEVNAPDDTFVVVNEPASEALEHNKEVRAKLFEKSEQIVASVLQRYPDLLGSRSATRPVEINLGGRSVVLNESFENSNDLSRRVTNLLATVVLSESSITSDDLLSLQRKIMGDTNDRSLIYMFDNCFSGSATDDALAHDSSTKAILASSAETEVSWQDTESDEGKGAFMSGVFEHLEQGMSLGEAFIRTDMKLHSVRGKQNPRAAVRNEDGDFIRVSSIQEDLHRNVPVSGRGLDGMQYV